MDYAFCFTGRISLGTQIEVVLFVPFWGMLMSTSSIPCNIVVANAKMLVLDTDCKVQPLSDNTTGLEEEYAQSCVRSFIELGLLHVYTVMFYIFLFILFY
jgi:hypothetical protein